MSYLYHLLAFFGVYMLLGASLNLIVGYCGCLSLAHAGYFAIGCYAYALGTKVVGLSFLPALALAGVAAALLSLILSLPTWRLKGDFFTMVSIAVQVLVFSVLHNWWHSGQPLGTWGNMTNGPLGITDVVAPSLGGVAFNTPSSTALLLFAIGLLLTGALWFLLKSPWGRALKIMRGDELAARSIGKNTRLLKVQAFAIACGLAAVAGGLYASFVRFIDPSLGSIDESILILSMLLVGGLGNVIGPVVGAFVLLLIPEGLRLVSIPASVAPNVRLLVYGLLLVVMMHVMPKGLAGDYELE